MADIETVEKNFAAAKAAFTKWLDENPVRLVPRRGPNFCYIKVMKPRKENPEEFVEAYEIPLYVPMGQKIEIEKAGR
ncbi:hypothetical protein ACQKLP_04365 [Chitinophaga sp. NPDC101104]|uniref:hypothetical protein n=1 Tax=Chitinophaga sp. NPDC101104 TaxID=3390561 RepID=UPI003CFCBA71